jgi:hypothetical protein
MDVKNNRLIFSESDQAISKMPAEADVADAGRYYDRTSAQLESARFVQTEANGSPLRSDLGHTQELGQRILKLEVLMQELAGAMPVSPVDRAINDLLNRA